MSPYPLFVDVVKSLRLDLYRTDWERALRIAEHLTLHARDLGPIQSDLQTTYRKITTGHGYCADFVKVFIGLALTATICCRQWAFSFDGFGGHGHTIVEIFDTASHKWRFIDVYNNIHACDARTGIPMTALEFRDALLSGYPAFNIHRNGAGRIGFPVEEKLIAYYKRGLQEWYLICGNAVFTREANVLVRRLSRLPGPLGRFISGLGERTAIQILATPDNLQRVDALLMVKRNLLIAAVALGMLLFMLIVLVCRTFVVWT